MIAQFTASKWSQQDAAYGGFTRRIILAGGGGIRCGMRLEQTEDGSGRLFVRFEY
jgi:hypothetical protein